MSYLLRELSYQDNGAILRHFDSLGTEAKQNRFFCQPSPTYISRYLSTIHAVGKVYGVFRENQLVGVSHITPLGDHFIYAYSVSEYGEGLDKLLLDNALKEAKNQNGTRLHIPFLNTDRSLQRLLLESKATITQLGNDFSQGSFDLVPSGTLSEK